MHTLNFIVLVSDDRARRQAREEMCHINNVIFYYLTPKDPIPTTIHGIYQHGYSYRKHNLEKLIKQIETHTNW